MITRLSWSSIKFICLILIVLPSAIHSFSLFAKKHKHGKQAERPPLFIAHRGDKFLIPEHTIPAYDVAMLTNVDYVEPDLVMTKDGVFVCHHDITLKDGTDVASHIEFASLMTQNKTLFLDGKNVTIVNDWLISDFTLAQLSTLRVYQKKTGWRPQYFNGYYGIPTFQQYLDAVHKDTWRRQQKDGNGTDFIMGIIPELKHPSYHNDVVFHSERRMEKDFLEVLRENGYLDNQCQYNYTQIPCSPLVVQCFQVETINYLSDNTNLTLLTLLDTQNYQYLTYGGMRELVNKTAYVSVWKEILYTGIEAEMIYKNVSYDKEDVEELGGFIAPRELVGFAHELGMKVGIYTIYHSEQKSYRGCALQCETNTTKEEELDYYLDMGVDAFFVEGLSESLLIRERWFMGSGEAGGRGGISGGNGNGGKANLWVILAVALLSICSYR